MDTMTNRNHRLDQAFFDRPTLEVAPDLLGKFLVYRSPDGLMSAKIVEVEAYLGDNDPACHAARGLTKRNKIMFGPPGFAYIYFIYGMYHCLNFVTERQGCPAAVLVRAAEPINGEDTMMANSPGKQRHRLLDGPGKLCRSFGLTFEQNGLDLTGGLLHIEDRHSIVSKIERSSRVGIKEGTELLYRFYDTDSDCLSVRTK